MFKAMEVLPKSGFGVNKGILRFQQISEVCDEALLMMRCSMTFTQSQGHGDLQKQPPKVKNPIFSQTIDAVVTKFYMTVVADNALQMMGYLMTLTLVQGQSENWHFF